METTKVALITGVGSGMGRLAARRLAAAGSLVAALDRSEVGLEETVRGAERIRPWVVDVTDRRVMAARRIPPERVLDEIERCLDRGRFWVFASWQFRAGWYLRRLAPGLLWRINHRLERP